MGDIPANRNVQPVQPPLGAANGQRVQQRLSGVFMFAIPGIQNCAIYFFRQ